MQLPIGQAAVASFFGSDAVGKTPSAFAQQAVQSGNWHRPVPTVARPATRLSPRRNSHAPVMICWRPRPRSTTRYGHPWSHQKDGRMAPTVALDMFLHSADAKGLRTEKH